MLIYNPKLVVFNTHTDDAVIAAGAFIHDYAMRKRERFGDVITPTSTGVVPGFKIVTFTCGASKCFDEAKKLRKVTAQERLSEFNGAMSALGVHQDDIVMPPWVHKYENKLADKLHMDETLTWLYKNIDFKEAILVAPVDDGHQDHAFVSRIADIISTNRKMQLGCYFKYALPYKIRKIPPRIFEADLSIYKMKLEALREFKTQIFGDYIYRVKIWDEMMGCWVGCAYGEGFWEYSSFRWSG